MTTETTDDRVQAARESFFGRTLTDSQFTEAWAIAGILRGEIERSGSFREPLTDYAHAYARNEKFDALRGEASIRDVYQGRYGESLNQTREALLEVEKALPKAAQARALAQAETVGELIQAAPTQPFYQAYDRAAVALSRELKITQLGAKALMKDAYQAQHGRDLYEVGKELEAAHHRPVREAQIAERKAEQLQARGQSPVRSQSRA